MKSNIDESTSRIEREQEFHDQRFSEPDVRRTTVSKYYAITKSMFKDFESILFKESSHMRILEYGCGTGSYIFRISKCNPKSCIGIDISPVAISQAQSRAVEENISEKLEFKVMNAENLTFPNNSMDLIFGSGILHHLDIEKAVSSISRVLDVSGTAVFIEPLGHNPLINRYRDATPDIRSEDEHPLLMNDIEQLYSCFSNVDIEYYYLSSLAASFFVGTPFFNSALRFFEYCDKLLFKFPLFQKNAWFALIKVSHPK